MYSKFTDLTEFHC